MWTDHVVPRFTNLLLGTKSFGRAVRADECQGLHGDVLELGFGSGTNLEYLPPEVTGIWTVEPSHVALKLASKRIAASGIPVTLGALDGARLNFPDDRFDAALSTMTLCTIPDVEAALAEVRRVLKPGAYFHFAEHGPSPDPKVARQQEKFEPLQMRMAGGCHLTRDAPTLIEKAGFEIEEVRHLHIKGPKVASYMSIGRARNPAN